MIGSTIVAVKYICEFVKNYFLKNKIVGTNKNRRMLKCNPPGDLSSFCSSLNAEFSFTCLHHFSCAGGLILGRCGCRCGVVGQQLYFYPAILRAARGGLIAGHGLVFANANQIKPVRGHVVFCG